jgi:anti-sigma factor RsiW
VSALKATTDCVLYARALHAYVDGELSVDHTAELEAHIVKCAECFEQVEQHRALRLSLRRTAATTASTSFRDRMAAMVATEAVRPAGADRSETIQRPASSEAKLVPLRHVMALAAAAGVVFAVGMARVQKGPTSFDEEGRAPSHVGLLSSMNLDDFIDDLVDMHASPLPPETTNPEELPRFDPFVGVPVRRPAMPTFQPLNVRYDGARMQAVRGKRAALLLYTMQGGHRVTMYVFDAQTVPLQRTHLQPRVVRQQPVYVGNVRGYSFAATERGGVGYALATDLDDDTSAKLVAAVQ